MAASPTIDAAALTVAYEALRARAVGDQATVTTTATAPAGSTETVLVVASMVLASRAGEQP